MDCHKSMGPDGIHPRVLRELADVTAGPLSIIYQRSWSSGEVSDDWRLANVTHIYKKGHKEDMGQACMPDLGARKGDGTGHLSLL